MDSLGRVEQQEQIIHVAPENAAKIWHEVEPLLQKALVRSHALNKTNTTHIFSNILQRRVQLWIAHDGRQLDAAVIGYVLEWPLSKTYYLPIIGGRPFALKRWLEPMRDALEHYALAQGCSDLGGEFRKGWAKSAGFEITGVTLRRAL